MTGQGRRIIVVRKLAGAVEHAATPPSQETWCWAPRIVSRRSEGFSRMHGHFGCSEFASEWADDPSSGSLCGAFSRGGVPGLSGVLTHNGRRRCRARCAIRAESQRIMGTPVPRRRLGFSHCGRWQRGRGRVLAVGSGFWDRKKGPFIRRLHLQRLLEVDEAVPHRARDKVTDRRLRPRAAARRRGSASPSGTPPWRRE